MKLYQHPQRSPKHRTDSRNVAGTHQKSWYPTQEGDSNATAGRNGIGQSSARSALTAPKQTTMRPDISEEAETN